MNAFLEVEDLAKDFGGIHAVGRTAVKAPRLFLATYTPKGSAAKRKHVALVGKGITYDTGGLSLKGYLNLLRVLCVLCGY